MDELPTLDSHALRRAGRRVPMPFYVGFRRNGDSHHLLCHRLLRVLPGKRLVCFGQWNGREVVIKFFLDPRRARNHCRREVNGIRALADAGIRTPALLFEGALTPDGSPVIGLQRLTTARDLVSVWAQVTDDAERTELVQKMVTAIADQHGAGLRQQDQHLGNFLLWEEDIYTIDGDAVDIRHGGRPLSESRSLKNLGLFFAQFYPRFDHLTAAALAVYAQRRAWHPDPRRFARLCKHLQRQRKRREKKYLNKVFRECSALVFQKSRRRLMVCDRRYYGREMARFLDAPDTLIASGRLMKKGNSSTVVRVFVDGRQLVVKRYNIKNRRHALKRFFRPSRAWVSWRNAHRFELLGIATPKPVAFLEKRWGPFRSTAYFIMEYVGGTNVSHLLEQTPWEEIDQGRLGHRFQSLFRQFSDAGVSHGDFKGTNFIVNDDGVYVVDLDGVRAHRFRRCFRRAFQRDMDRFIRNWKNLPHIRLFFHEQFKKLQAGR